MAEKAQPSEIQSDVASDSRAERPDVPDGDRREEAWARLPPEHDEAPPTSPEQDVAEWRETVDRSD
jgi:hypothetical protein